jgi:hypothetical protein
MYWAEAFHRSRLLHTSYVRVCAAFGCIIITCICLRCPRFYSLFVFALMRGAECRYSWRERDNLSFVGVIWRKWGPRFITIEFSSRADFCCSISSHGRRMDLDATTSQREKNVFVLRNEAAFQISVGRVGMRFIMFAPAATKLILLFDALQRIGEISFKCVSKDY